MVVVEATGVVLLSLAEKAIAPGVGALFGALAAFRLERFREERKQRRQRGLALQRARFVVSIYEERLSSLWEKHLLPSLDHPARWRDVMVISAPDKLLSIDLYELLFLFDGERDSILRRAHKLESMFTDVLLVLGYTERYLERLWAWVADIRLTNPHISAEELDERVDPSIRMPLTSFTDDLFLEVPKALELARQVGRDLDSLPELRREEAS